MSVYTKLERERKKGLLLSTLDVRLEKILMVDCLVPVVRRALQTAQIAKEIHSTTDRTMALTAIPPMRSDFENNAVLLGVVDVDLKISYVGRPPHIDMLQHARQVMQMAQINHNHEIRIARNKMDAGLFQHTVNEEVLDQFRIVVADLFLKASSSLAEKGFANLAQHLKDLNGVTTVPGATPVDLYLHDRNLRRLAM